MADTQIITDVPLFTNELNQNDKKLIVLSPSSLPFDDNPTKGSHNLVNSNTIYNLLGTLKNEVLIGTVIAFAANPDNPPYGCLLCNGGAVSRTIYKELFDIIGTTYGEGDGSTTFNLPNLINKFVMGSSNAGIVKAAGLPNITGSMKAAISATYGSYILTGGTGAIETANTSKNGTVRAAVTGSSRLNRTVVNIDASKSNEIYGNSTTVQPPAVTMRFYIKYK